MRRQSKLFLLLTALIVTAFLISLRHPSGRESEGRGDLHFQRGELEDALGMWKEALEGNPHSSKLLDKMGIAYMRLGQGGEAIEVYQRALEVDGDDLRLRYNLALAYISCKEYQNSIMEAERVMKISPSYPGIHFLRGVLYEESGQLNEAEREYVKEINVNPTHVHAWWKLEKPH